MANNLSGGAVGRGIAPGRLWSDVVVLVGSVALFIISTSIPNFGLDVLGPAFMPQFVLGVLIVLSGLDIALLFRNAQVLRSSTTDKNGKDRDDPEFQVVMRPRSLAALCALAAYVAVLNFTSLSFEIVSVVYVIGTGIIAGARTKQAIALLVAIAIVYAFAVAWIFRSVFFVVLP